MSFGFSAPCPYLLDGIKFCFHLNPIFRLLPSKTGTMKKITTLKQHRRHHHNINRDKDTSKIRDMWILRNDKKIKQFWCKLSDCKLRPKSSES